MNYIDLVSILEKAESKSQQRLFGMVRSIQKGETKAPNKELKKMADDISPKDVKDFAETKHKNLPEKKTVKESLVINPIIKKQRSVEYDVCPHCNEEILEKSTFVIKGDDEYYVYHRGDCARKSPIDSFPIKSDLTIEDILGK